MSHPHIIRRIVRKISVSREREDLTRAITARGPHHRSREKVRDPKTTAPPPPPRHPPLPPHTQTAKQESFVTAASRTFPSATTVLPPQQPKPPRP